MNDALKLLSEQTFCTLSTVCEDGRPWGTPVFVVVGEDETIYWWSALGSQHSKNIAANPQVFITAFGKNDTESKAAGAYIQAKAHQVADQVELGRAMEAYNSKARVFKLDNSKTTGDSPSRLFAAVAERCWVNAEGSENGHYVDVRRDVS